MLGLKPLKIMNQALSGKWLWKLGEEQDSLWYMVVVAKYGGFKGGWDICGPVITSQGFGRALRNFSMQILSSASKMTGC